MLPADGAHDLYVCAQESFVYRKRAPRLKVHGFSAGLRRRRSEAVKNRRRES